MSSRPLLIAGLVGGILAGVALFASALALVATDGPSLSGSTMAPLVLGAVLGWVFDATWLCLVLDRLAKLSHGSEGEEGDGGEGWGRPGPDRPKPWRPSEGPDWWPEFERDFRVHVEEHDRTPVPG